MQISNLNRAFVIPTVQYVTHGPYCDMASATCIMQHATCTCNNQLRKARDRQRGTLNVTDATTYNDNIQPARASNARTIRHATCDVRRTPAMERGTSTHTHSMQPLTRTEKHGRGGHTNCLVQPPCMGETCHDGMRRGRSCTQTNKQTNKQITIAVGPPRRMGGGNCTPLPGCHV